MRLHKAGVSTRQIGMKLTRFGGAVQAFHGRLQNAQDTPALYIWPRRGPQDRDGDAALVAEIRALVDQRPTYGYRRVIALLKRKRRSNGHDPVNAKRVYRLMKKHGRLLARHTGRRQRRKHEGRVIAPVSKLRWCSDGLEFTCWNGGIVRVACATDCHDREVIGWIATTAGISRAMIRDLMVECVETRFGVPRAPHAIEWLTDNGSVYAEACFTPVEGPESNGIAEAFVKTFKRDYVRISPLPDARTALATIEEWMEDYNEIHPHSGLAYRSPRSASL